MTMAFSNALDQDLEASLGPDAASSSDRPIQGLHVRACTNCVRAKAKCSTSAGVTGRCERCHRMNKDCQPSPPVRKRRTLKTPIPNKTYELEKKLDGLVTLLKSSTQGTPGIVNAIPINPPLNGSVPLSHENVSSSMATHGVGHRDHIYNRPLPYGMVFPEPSLTPAASSSTESIPVNLQPVLHPALEPSPDDAESYLNKFRTDFIKHFPFIIISPSMTAHQLRQQRPLLWFSIMTAASNNSTQQILMSREMRIIIAHEAYIEGTRNMDILLAILVYTAWDRQHCFERPILMSLVQLAIAILYDLRLDKPPSKDSALFLAYDLKGARKPSRLSSSPTMEERRAFLGCFLMSSVSTSYLEKGDTLRWAAYSDECLREIEAQEEFASDVLLVQLVKLRLIFEKASDTPWSGAMVEADRLMRPHALFYLNSLEAQLRDFKSKIPSRLTDNKTLLMELYTTELKVYEIGLSHASDIFSGQYNQRLECICACINAVKSWIDVFLDILPAQYVGFSASLYSSMARCFTGVCRLSAFDHPEWDRGLFRANLNVPLFLEKAEKNFSQVKEAAGFDIGDSNNTDSFSMMASKIRSIKMFWDATNVSTSSSIGITASDDMSVFAKEFQDDDWLRDLLGL